MKRRLVNGKQPAPEIGEFSAELLQHVYDAFTATTLVEQPLLDGKQSSVRLS